LNPVGVTGTPADYPNAGMVRGQVTPTGFKMTRWDDVAINRATPTGTGLRIGLSVKLMSLSERCE